MSIWGIRKIQEELIPVSTVEGHSMDLGKQANSLCNLERIINRLPENLTERIGR